MGNNVMKVKVKLSFDQVLSLIQIYKVVINNEPAEEMEELVICHSMELLFRLQMLAVKQQAKYLLSLSITEAMAFNLQWAMETRPINSYTAEIIRVIIGEIDKAFMDFKKSKFLL